MKIAGYEVHPAAELFPVLDEVGLQRLADDIKAHGLKVPVVLLDGKILDGRNRILACKKIGVEPATIEHDGKDPWRTVWSLNAERRQIEDKVRLALIGKRMVEGSDAWKAKQERAKAETSKARSEATKKQHAVSNPRRGEKSGPASREATPKRDHRAEDSKKTTSRLASEAGVSRATMERAIELERKRPEAAAAVARGEVEGHKALAEVKRAERMENLAEVAKGNAPLPTGEKGIRYPVIYADPPWRYEHVETESRAIENQYPTMDLDAICDLEVYKLATPDSILFLWATSPKLAEAMKVMDEWGFTYRTCAVWVKDKIGMGYYYRQRHELLLVGTRGSMPTPAPADRPDSVIEAKVGAHSAKPLIAAEQIKRMYPGLPKLEMFCRSPREGWSAWGNQAA